MTIPSEFALLDVQTSERCDALAARLAAGEQVRVRIEGVIHGRPWEEFDGRSQLFPVSVVDVEEVGASRLEEAT